MSRPRKSTVPPHLPVPDPQVPADPLDPQHRGYCRRCGVAIVDGDPRHQLPDIPEQAAHAARYDREETHDGHAAAR